MNSISAADVASIERCLEACNERFSNYQEIPKFIRAMLPRPVAKTKYEKRQLDLDERRYNFLIEQIKLNGLSVTEIGSNLGYFGLRLAHEFNCDYTGYEPLHAYCNAANTMAEAANLTSHCRFIAKPIGLDDIAALPASDLIVELNVLHHGGAIFDQEQVKRLHGWKNYAVERLGALRKKGSALLFQTGNVADNRSLFPTDQAVLFIFDLLSAAGWTPRQLATIDDLERLTYVIRDVSARAGARNYVCRRNPETNMVDYWADGRLAGSLISGLANRPIWFCE